MHKMDKLMEKKKGKKLSDNEVKAKSHVLKDLSDTASDMMKDRLAGLKKGSVAAPSKEGLQQGLDMAKKLTEKMPMPEESGMGDAKEHEEEMVKHAEADKSVGEDYEHADDSAHEDGEEAAESEEEAGEEKSKEELLAELERLKAKIEKMS